MDMTPQRWAYTSAYVRAVFGDDDPVLRGLADRAAAAGLPDIAVTAEVGRLLKMLTSMTRAERALEVGTLGGYSGIWIARGLRDGGRLITIEREERHAEFARRAFRESGVDGRIDLRRGDALAILPDLAQQLGPESLDLVFLDADRQQNEAYFRTLRPMIRPGGVLVSDNALGAGGWWIDDPPGTDDDRDAADRFNRLLAADPWFEAVVMPVRQGLLLARRLPA